MNKKFKYDDVISFAKEYIKLNSISMSEVLSKGIRIDNPGTLSEEYKNIRSIFISGAAFFSGGKVVCSDLLEFEWQKDKYDLRIYSPNYLEFPNCSSFLYTEEYVKGYLTREEWLETPYRHVSLPDDVVLLRLYMEKDLLVCSECMLDDCRTQVVKPKSGTANFLSDLMNFVKRPIKEAIILNTSNTNLRMHRCNDGEYLVVLGG